MLSQQEAQIAQLKLVGNNHENIAEALSLDVAYIDQVLKKADVLQWMEEAEITALSRWVELTRLKWAKDIMDKIIDGIRLIANEVDARAWNKNHVELFKMLVQNIAKEDVKALQVIQNNFIQNNTVVHKSALNGLDEKLGKIPARKQAEFWRDVEDLVLKYTTNATAIEIVQES